MGKRTLTDGQSLAALTPFERLAGRLFQAGDERREKFLSALHVGEAAQTVVLDLHSERSGSDDVQESEPRRGWMPPWVRHARAGEEPGKADQHERGDWYILDQSSVFCAAPLLSLGITKARALDLCASPGGKACFLWRALHPRVLVTNEPIQGRIKALISNIKRCRIDPCVVIRRDPSQLVQELPSFFDVVLVDAPCSGQSLTLKGKPAAGAFHASTVNMNVRRQRRILSAAAALVGSGGTLVYSTCTFSREENEGNLEWFLKRNPSFSAREVPALSAHQSHLSDVHCYRLWPFEGYGAGGFTACLDAGAGVERPGRSPLPRVLPHIEWSSASGKETLMGEVSDLLGDHE